MSMSTPISSLDISVVKTPTLELKILEDVTSDEEGEEVEDNVGRFVWPTAVPMLRHMMSSCDIKKSSLIVELGAGCGVLGMGLAAAATTSVTTRAVAGTVYSGQGDSNQTKNLHIILTDHDNEWMQRNFDLNETMLRERISATMEVARLDWRNPDDIATVQTIIQERLSTSASDSNNGLMIVASDVLYNHDTHQDLATTLYELSKSQSTRIIIGFPDRDNDEDHFRPFAKEIFGDMFVSSKPMIDNRQQNKRGRTMDLRVIDFYVEKS